MKKDIFYGKLRNPKGGILCICLVSGITFAAAIALLFIIFFKLESKSDKVMLLCFCGVLVALGVLYPVLSIHYARMWPNHRKVNLLFFQEYMFYSPEELEKLEKAYLSDKQENYSLHRELTITCRKSGWGAVSKNYVYVQTDGIPDCFIDECPCRLLGTFKNGQSVTFTVPTESVKIFISKGEFNGVGFCDFITLPQGTERIERTCGMLKVLFLLRYLCFDKTEEELAMLDDEEFEDDEQF